MTTMALASPAVRRRRRAGLLVIALLLLGGATALVLTAFEDNLVFFYSPTQVAADEVEPGQRIRVGGLVEEGSVRQLQDGAVEFSVTDGAESLTIRFAGMLPDLFREGQGIVSQGRIQPGGMFVAEEVLAKHDENYMPAEVQKALEESGYWQHAGESAP